MIKFIVTLQIILFVSCSPVKMYRDDPEVKAWEGDIEKLITRK